MKHPEVGALFIIGLLLGSLPAAAQAPVIPTIQVGLVSWPADTTNLTSAFGGDIEDCLILQIRDTAPEIILTPQRQVRNALFPLLEPATQPGSEAEFAALIGRQDVQNRLARQGLHYLVAFTGGTSKGKPGGFIACGGGFGAGGCLGFAWEDESTRLDAALWRLDTTEIVRREGAKVEGTSVMPAFILPVPIPARTRSTACRALGTQLVAAIRQVEAGQPTR